MTFIDSSGIHRLLVAHRHAAERSIRLAIIPGAECVQRTFALCGLVDALPFIPAVSPARGGWAA